MNNSIKTIISVILLLLVILGVTYLVKKPATPEETKENVVVTQNEGGESNLPVGLPIETEKVTENYSQAYVDRGVTLHGYTYVSQKSPSEVQALYMAYAEANGYSVEETGSGENEPSFMRTKSAEGDELMVIASTNGIETTVQVVYTDRNL